MPDPILLDPGASALVLIDLQRGIVGMPVAPRDGAAVVRNAGRLLEAFRGTGALVVLVRVSFSADGGDMLSQPRDVTWSAANRPADWDELLPELGVTDRDLVITKRQWGAFYGTPLDMQLRRRGIRSIVIGGISTNMGVESTARDAFERGYHLVFAEDAMAATSAEAHRFACEQIFPRIGQVRSTDEVVRAIGG